MLIVKMIGCTFILVSCTGMGWVFGGEIKRRLEDLKSAKTIAILLRGDIRYAQTALPEAFENAARRHEGSLKPFLRIIANELAKYEGTSLYEIWKNAINEQLKDTALTTKDKGNLKRLGESLGSLDKNTQVNTIDWYISQVEEDMRVLTIDAKDKIRLYRSLGVLAGIFVVIIFV